MNDIDAVKVKKVKDELTKLVNEIFKLINIKFEDTTELERQVIATFTFGLINAISLNEGLNQPQIHALTIAVLIDEFKYSEEQGASFSQELIKATKREYHPVMNNIIHRGIDGYYQYNDNQIDDLKDNITNVLDIVNKKA
jgi:hypothetical protein